MLKKIDPKKKLMLAPRAEVWERGAQKLGTLRAPHFQRSVWRANVNFFFFSSFIFLIRTTNHAEMEGLPPSVD